MLDKRRVHQEAPGNVSVPLFKKILIVIEIN
jgi:hypothetical protein